MKDQFDIIIIGSGAGGAPIAHTLVKAGKSVLLLEKGPLFCPQHQGANGRRSDFKRDELISDGPEKRIQIREVSNRWDPYYSSHFEPDLNDEPHVYRDKNDKDKATIEGYTAQVIGGGTTHYGGVSLRFSPLDLQLRSFNESRNNIKEDPKGDIKREARDWPISYNDLEPYYAKTEELVGINGTVENQRKPFSRNVYQPPLAPNEISQYAKCGMELLAREINPNAPIAPYRTPIALITRDHAPSGRKVNDPETAKTSYVNRYGDPLGQKSSTWASLLSPVKDHPNFTIRCNCVVTHLTYQNGKVDRVHYLDPSGTPRTAQGEIVVVACSAIESVRLLKLSARLDRGFDRAIHQNDLLGRYFLTHCLGGASAFMPGRFDKSKALDADWATDCCSTEDFLHANGLWGGGTLYNNTSDEALPLSLFRTIAAQDLDTLWKGFMQNTNLKAHGIIEYLDRAFGRGLSMAFLANQVPQYNNRIELHPDVKDKWNRPVAYIIKTWHQHDIYLMNTFADMCGRVLRYGAQNLGGPLKFIGRDRADQFEFIGEGGVYMAENGLSRIANHILGGARFGTNRADSVLDSNCRAWDFENLYVTDGAFTPTSGSCNPTNTIEANSFRIADHLLTRL